MIFLPKYVCEGDCMLDAFLPLRAFESKERFGIALGDRRQLEEIACNDQLWSWTSSLHHRSENDCYVPVCRQMAVRSSSVDPGQLTRAYQIGARPPWKLDPICSSIVRRDRGLECSPSSMTNILVAFHRLSAGLHVRTHFICLSRSA